MAISRRRALELTICGAAFGATVSAHWWTRRLPWMADISSTEHGLMQAVAMDFMGRFDVPGLSVVISREGTLVYNKTFGVADRESRQPVTTSSLFRIASVSKPITWVGIFKLVEKRKLDLQDRVFGPNGILGTRYGSQPYRPYVTEICVDHLLTHTAGGWPKDATDPMFRFPRLSQADLISWTLDNLALEHPPGEQFAYSNFGFYLLGRIIETIAQVPTRNTCSNRFWDRVESEICKSRVTRFPNARPMRSPTTARMMRIRTRQMLRAWTPAAVGWPVQPISSASQTTLARPEIVPAS